MRRQTPSYLLSAVLAAVVVLLAACSPPSSDKASAPGGARNAATAADLADMGGMDALIAAAKKEGQLNVAGLAPDWVNYGAIIAAFEKKYGIKVNSAIPNGGGQDEVNLVKQLKGTGRAPDVIDAGQAVVVSSTHLFAPYKVAAWSQIPAAQKEPSGLWTQDYGGYVAIAYDSSRVPPVTSVQDLLKPAYRGKVALFGDPTHTNSALMAVMMTSLAVDKSGSGIGPGVEFFSQLKKLGNFIPVSATAATVKNGTTPVVISFDYQLVAYGQGISSWHLFVPPNAVLGGYFAQAINKDASHPAAARLWEEFLYSPEGQNLWLAGNARPVLMDVMTANGTIDKKAAAALPAVKGKPRFLTFDEATAAANYLVEHWDSAIS